MTILKIYQKYQIMPQLQEHQLRVAGVAGILCEHSTLTPTLSQREREEIMAACLLHDMGNIVKFDLDQAHKYLTPPQEHGRFDYWKNVKQESLQKYGSGSHNVTMRIIGELGVSERVRELADCVGFSQAAKNAESSDLGKKICAYSDMRVAPQGVVALEERLADLRLRYQNHPEGEEKRENFEAALRQIERQIFARCKIKPTDITEAAVAEKKEELKKFELGLTR